QEHEIGNLYRKLIALKKSKAVLGNGEYGARMIQVPNSKMDKVFSFVRCSESEKVFVVINFSNEYLEVTFEEPLFQDEYTQWQHEEKRNFEAGSVCELEPWQFEIWVA
ncbi:MAG: alpha amylase C-terminal domain-containing protein, partial [Pseudomonadota bacterium]|nr:alpha amylase C-terminal domain-containing protein [Pseudomonadota bacterium]